MDFRRGDYCAKFQECIRDKVIAKNRQKICAKCSGFVPIIGSHDPIKKHIRLGLIESVVSAPVERQLSLWEDEQ